MEIEGMRDAPAPQGPAKRGKGPVGWPCEGGGPSPGTSAILTRGGLAPASLVLASWAEPCPQAMTIAPDMAMAIERNTLPKDLMVVPPSQVPWRRRSLVARRTAP